MKTIDKIILVFFFSGFLYNYSQEAKTYIVQEAKKSNATASPKGFVNLVPFGEYINYKVDIPGIQRFTINDIVLEELDKKQNRDFYRDNNPDLYDDHFKTLENVNVTLKNGFLNVPPLKPNRFYRVQVHYTDKYTLLDIFKLIREEGKYELTHDLKKRKKWMNKVDDKSEKLAPFSLYYVPSIDQLTSYKQSLSKFNLVSIDKPENESERKKLVKLSLNAFQILSFQHISDHEIVEFARKIAHDFNEAEEDANIVFLSFFKINDYINIYKFYEDHLKQYIEDDDHELSDVELGEFINRRYDAIIRKLDDTDYVPNFFNVEESDNIKSNLSTYPNSFQTAFKRTLVPDFGYVAFINPGSNSASRGGSPFVGVSISLTAVNKNTPLALTKHSFSQRFALHTGVILESIKEENVRDDFFQGMSLMIGGSYKVITQSTRIISGVIIYNKIDAVSASKSIAIQPYIGLSIDIEIRKWLAEIIPSFGKNFKK